MRGLTAVVLAQNFPHTTSDIGSTCALTSDRNRRWRSRSKSNYLRQFTDASIKDRPRGATASAARACVRVPRLISNTEKEVFMGRARGHGGNLSARYLRTPACAKSSAENKGRPAAQPLRHARDPAIRFDFTTRTAPNACTARSLDLMRIDTERGSSLHCTHNPPWSLRTRAQKSSRPCDQRVCACEFLCYTLAVRAHRAQQSSSSPAQWRVQIY